MSDVPDAIRAIYAQVHAPDWAAANLDALADVLRDLSWLPDGPVEVSVPEVGEPGTLRLLTVLLQAVEETADGPHPVVLVPVSHT